MLRSCAALLLSLSPAFAEEPAWPAEFRSIIEEDRSMCAAEFSVAPESVVQRDLNGDGTQDWILDTAGFACSDSYEFYCGTQGCSVETLIDGTLGSLTLRSWDTVTENGTTYLTAPNDQGKTVRFLWTGNEWQLQ
jgi:hypothetical protein